MTAPTLTLFVLPGLVLLLVSCVDGAAGVGQLRDPADAGSGTMIIDAARTSVTPQEEK